MNLRKADLHGILNGIDTAEWDPSRDASLPANYDEDSLEKKAVCKEVLQKENRLEMNKEKPLFGFVGRLADQKGVDLLEPILERIVDGGWQLVLLGAGEEQYQERFRQMTVRYPGSISANLGFNSALANRIYAGSDIFLIPSRFEPCGLSQMIALKYGAVPLVREVGGLADTVQEFNPKSGKGNGFVFLDYSPDALFDTMRRAVRVFQSEDQWKTLVNNGMKCDFSWERSAKQYVDVYSQVGRKPIGV